MAGMTHVDSPRDTRLLAAYAGTFRDVQQLRIASAQREIATAFVDALEDLEGKLATAVRKELRRHPMWPWLDGHPGLGGVQIATLLARIGNPNRFPGQPCSLGHISPPGRGIGEPCPAVGPDDAPCPGVMLERRPGTGVRALWHYCGLHVVDGHAPRRTRGQRNDWDSRCRTPLLMPKGIADQIVINNLQPWRSIYDATKARKLAGTSSAIDSDDGERDSDGPAEAPGAIATRTGGPVAVHRAFDVTHGGPADATGVSVSRTGGSDRAVARDEIETLDGTVTPGQAHSIARTVAVKAFVGDLLRTWKSLEPSAYGDA